MGVGQRDLCHAELVEARWDSAPSPRPSPVPDPHPGPLPFRERVTDLFWVMFYACSVVVSGDRRSPLSDFTRVLRTHRIDRPEKRIILSSDRLID